ncbi:MAG TPA: hypothetical protein VFE25_07440 [Opitutaceae bacterium]|nr:hypothetical protein [Opitutaceae bacterium]
MNLPSDTPKLQKWMFLLGDAILLTVAWFIHDGADHPYAGMALISTVACVMLAVVIGVIPFVTEYARRQDEALDNRHRSLQALAVTVAAASEQVSIAATGLNGISEAAQDNYSKTERLAKQIADKVAELDEQLAKAKVGDSDTLAKLDAFVAKLGKATAEIEAAAAKESKAAETRRSAKAAAAAAVAAAAVIPEPAPVIANTIPEVKPAVVASETPFVPPVPLAPEPEPEIVVAPVVAEVPKPEPVAEAAPEAAPEPVPEPVQVEPAKAEVAAEPAPAETSAAEPLASDPMETTPPVALPPRKRAPKKPAAAPTPEPEPEIVTAAADLVLESPAEEPAPVISQEISEPAVSADGATRLIITAYIGIGNRLFIRGDGPGLSWDKGVPLTFVSIGKWRWETNDATSTIRFRLFKNDSVECTTLGEASVEPGAQQELSAAF